MAALVTLLSFVAGITVAPATAGPKSGAGGGASGGGRETGVGLTRFERAQDCDPTELFYGPYQCYGESWGYDQGLSFGASSRVAAASVPSPVPVTSRTSAAKAGVHSLRSTPASVTYTWTADWLEYEVFHSDLAPAEGVPHALLGRRTGFATIDLEARHRTCPTCVGTASVVLAGEEPGVGSGPVGISKWDIDRTFTVVLRNTAGGTIPVGEVDVKVTLRTGAGGVPEPLWTGYSFARAAVRASTMTASG